MENPLNEGQVYPNKESVIILTPGFFFNFRLEDFNAVKRNLKNAFNALLTSEEFIKNAEPTAEDQYFELLVDLFAVTDAIASQILAHGNLEFVYLPEGFVAKWISSLPEVLNLKRVINEVFLYSHNADTRQWTPEELFPQVGLPLTDLCDLHKAIHAIIDDLTVEASLDWPTVAPYVLPPTSLN